MTKADSRLKGQYDKQLSTTSSLILELQESEKKRWEQFVRVYTPLIRFWISKHQIAANSQDDVLQECLVSVLKSIKEFTRADSKGTFRAWLKTIVHRRVLDHFRQQSRNQAQHKGDLNYLESVVPSNPEDLDAEEQEFLQLKARAMELVRQSCSERTWQMFWQTVVENRPSAVVAENFGVSSAAVRVARGRILKKLRNLLIDPENPRVDP